MPYSGQLGQERHPLARAFFSAVPPYALGASGVGGGIDGLAKGTV